MDERRHEIETVADAALQTAPFQALQ